MRLDAMTEAQARAARRALDEESARRRHLVVYLSGAHAYGFPSPDSDVDLKAVHIEPTSSLVGLRPPALHADRLEVIDGVEIDYTSNELGPALAGILAGNGNYLERILGSTWVETSPEHAELGPLVRAVLSRKVYRHYGGFARNQRQAAASAEQPTAKKILYVLRTALCGMHLLRTGELVVDLGELLDIHGAAQGLEGARELIGIKRAGERVPLADSERWLGHVERVLELLDEAHASSPLPDEPAPGAVAELEAWLIDMRRRVW